MDPLAEHTHLESVASRLAELLGHEATRVVPDMSGVDGRVEFPGLAFLVEWRNAADVAAIAGGLRALAAASRDALPLLAVPFMGEAGRRLCEDAGVNWLDLSGNARIVAPALRLEIQGKPNLFKRAGRPNSVFAPKSARIARWLLMHAHQPVTQQAIAEQTGMDRGFTSRIVRRLLADELVDRMGDGRIIASKPDVLLDAWAEQYRWGRHRIYKGVVAARSGTALAERLSKSLLRAGIEHAFTGLAAAWQYDHFATFNLATLYLPAGVSPGLQSDLGVQMGDRGANVWLVVPDDVGVVHGAADIDGLRCVHPVQAWLDLGAHPERAKEAADHLRQERMRWTRA